MSDKNISEQQLKRSNLAVNGISVNPIYYGLGFWNGAITGYGSYDYGALGGSTVPPQDDERQSQDKDKDEPSDVTAAPTGEAYGGTAASGVYSDPGSGVSGESSN